MRKDYPHGVLHGVVETEEKEETCHEVWAKDTAHHVVATKVEKSTHFVVEIVLKDQNQWLAVAGRDHFVAETMVEEV